jgi:hypothetical protein
MMPDDLEAGGAGERQFGLGPMEDVEDEESR